MSGRPRPSQGGGGGGAAGNGSAPRSQRPRPSGGAGGAYSTPGGGDDGSGNAKLGSAQGDKKIQDVQGKLDAVRDVMTTNMEMAITRGERLETIEAKSDVLLEDANKFQSQSAATKRMFCRRHWRNILVIAVIAATFLGLIIWWAS